MRHILLLAFLLASTSLFAQSADEKKATLKFLYALQQPDGGFIGAPVDPKADAKPKSSLRATSGAIRAIKYMGGELPNKEKTVEFVKSCYDKATGSFSDQPGGKADLAVTAVGMMAAGELYPATGLPYLPTQQYLAKNAKSFEERRLAVAGMEASRHFDPAIDDWFVELRKTRNADGTYGKGDGQARDTGGTIAMFLRAGKELPEDERKNVLTILQNGQRPDGGFGKAGERASDGETTYRVMRAFYLLKEKPKDVAKLKEFHGKCRNADGGYGVAPGQSSTVSGTYYVAIIGQWMQK